MGFPGFEAGRLYLRRRTPPACFRGAKERGIETDQTYIDRIEYELKIINDKGYAPYFLVVSDLLRFARENKIYATTRGSAAGSMVSYLTGITTVDPIEYKLPFERFLNPDRPSAPDIDMDFADNRRDEMFNTPRKSTARTGLPKSELSAP